MHWIRVSSVIGLLLFGPALANATLVFDDFTQDQGLLSGNDFFNAVLATGGAVIIGGERETSTVGAGQTFLASGGQAIVTTADLGAVSLLYDGTTLSPLSNVDVSQGGVNDILILDVAAISGSWAPSVTFVDGASFATLSSPPSITSAGLATIPLAFPPFFALGGFTFTGAGVDAISFDLASTTSGAASITLNSIYVTSSTAATVPEPGSLGLTAAGLAVLWFWRRRTAAASVPKGTERP